MEKSGTEVRRLQPQPERTASVCASCCISPRFPRLLPFPQGHSASNQTVVFSKGKHLTHVLCIHKSPRSSWGTRTGHLAAGKNQSITRRLGCLAEITTLLFDPRAQTEVGLLPFETRFWDQFKLEAFFWAVFQEWRKIKEGRRLETAKFLQAGEINPVTTEGSFRQTVKAPRPFQGQVTASERRVFTLSQETNTNRSFFLLEGVKSSSSPHPPQTTAIIISIIGL